MITWHGASPFSRALVAYLRGYDHPMKIRLARWLFAIAYPHGICMQNNLGGKMIVCPEDFISRHILWDGQYEGVSLALGARLLQDGGVFVDVGANRGLYVCSLGMLPKVTCVAIEPHAKNFALLQKNIRLNSQINAKLLNVCLDQERRFVELEDFNPLNSGQVRVALGDRSPNSFFHKVAAVPLKDVLKELQISSIRLLKIDVEGYEMPVLNGFPWESSCRPANILIEYSDYVSRVAHEGKESLLHFFENRGYEGFTIDGKPLSGEDPIPESNAWFRDRDKTQH